MSAKKEAELSSAMKDKFVKTLEMAGLTAEKVAKVVYAPDNKLASAIVSLIRESEKRQVSDVPGSVDVQKAKELMGKRFIPIEAVFYFSLNTDKPTVKRYKTVPFSEKELIYARSCGMILVAMPPLSASDFYFQLRDGEVFFPERVADVPQLLAPTRPGYFLMFPELWGNLGYFDLSSCLIPNFKRIRRKLCNLSVLELVYADLAWAKKTGVKLSRKQLFCKDSITVNNQLTVSIDRASFVIRVKDGVDSRTGLPCAAGVYRELPRGF